MLYAIFNRHSYTKKGKIMISGYNPIAASGQYKIDTKISLHNQKSATASNETQVQLSGSKQPKTYGDNQRGEINQKELYDEIIKGVEEHPERLDHVFDGINEDSTNGGRFYMGPIPMNDKEREERKVNEELYNAVAKDAHETIKAIYHKMKGEGASDFDIYKETLKHSIRVTAYNRELINNK